MSNSVKKLAQNLHKVLTESDARKVKSYDVKGEVLRDDGDIVWVKIPGGVDETPVQKTNNANIGDTVMVRIADGKAWLAGNNTSPATDDTRANIAYDVGTAAGAAANRAIDEAGRAMIAADQAEAEAGRATREANNAKNMAEQAEQSAYDANIYANSALIGLGQVEDVVGVLEWLTNHSTLTNDQTPIENKQYYIKSGDSFTLVQDVDCKNPSEEGWYELTEAVQNYILSHLTLTDEGLWVSGRVNEGRTLMSNSGVTIYDPIHGPVSSFGKSIRIGNTQNAYLELISNALMFYLNSKKMATFGYSEIFEQYGVEAENIFITGAGNALRLDNGVNGSYQGQYILETRANGHLSLKPGLRRTEEE